MAIKISNTSFYIETKNTSYQIKADKYGILKHVWYGEKTGCDMDYINEYPDVGFSGNIYDADNDRTYSPDTLPQEYPAFGNGDYRICAVSAVHNDGSCSLDLRFRKYEIKQGKYSIPGLPAVYGGENAQTLEITLEDKKSGLEVILKYGVLPELDVITRSAVIRNNSDSSITIKNAASFCLDMPKDNYERIFFTGRHAMERTPQRQAILQGIQESSSIRGTSSHQQNPSFIICSPDCNEDSGRCFGAALMYSGSFSTRIELDHVGQLRAVCGINPELFSWQLNSGEDFYTPEAILAFSSKGLAALSHIFHTVIRNNVCRGNYKLAQRPVLINNWEATYFDFNEEKLLKIAEEAAKLGVDMFVLDDGWFGKRDGDNSGLGDWFVNKEKLKNGLSGLADKINALGMKFGLWFEPEMVSEDSDLYRSHPDWAIVVPGRKPIRGRYQLVLDMTRSDVRDYLFDTISSILKDANISYIKWDMNRSITNWYSAKLEPSRMGEMPHRYVLGVYDLLERLTSAFPDVLFEGCSGGGGRFDAGMLYYCPQIWCSDNTDAHDRTIIQYGTSFFYPISAVGSHISAVPNHQTGRITPIGARSVTAMAGSFGYELDLNKLDDDEKHEVTQQIQRFKKYDYLIHNGRYYRLSDPVHGNCALWEYVSENGTEALLQGILFRAEANTLKPRIRFKGLDSDKIYILNEKEYTGAALMSGGILLPRAVGDYYPVEIYIKSK